jgi:hypothetical protein
MNPKSNNLLSYLLGLVELIQKSLNKQEAISQKRGWLILEDSSVMIMRAMERHKRLRRGMISLLKRERQKNAGTGSRRKSKSKKPAKG